ncbi:hypothetical protein HANVADRAFT_49728 [Hanseniaspora valbyensis NRRL Y-1626]|uniref:Uncharacterized protein n=1 Tax=Hanseniaspora valbyensis NRRL Y-1626 TaxID=766949 RepID=A0A1B7TAP7_9ASCO|nr:hypothetical protein HANVADRAFT_49728 [Hanseniaspora valbyensis NRRL Y-1626]
MKFSRTDDTDLICNQIIYYCLDLFKLSIGQINHNHTLDHIFKNKNNLIVKSDLMILTNKLINSVTDGNEIGIVLIEHDSLRNRLLLFFDKLYPVYDFINWIENNYRHNSLNFKNVLTYYIFKTLTINLRDMYIQVRMLKKSNYKLSKKFR